MRWLFTWIFIAFPVIGVAQQVAVALHKSGDKPVEIALNPPELGRVRLVMAASETGVVVQVLAERSDTLDLMRRNIDDLGRALSDLGYEDIAFSFGQGNSNPDHAPDEDDDRNATHLALLSDAPATDAPAQPTAHLAIAPDGVDIRL